MAYGKNFPAISTILLYFQLTVSVLSPLAMLTSEAVRWIYGKSQRLDAR